jgi:serine/threonine protein phosphatase PrpC
MTNALARAACRRVLARVRVVNFSLAHVNLAAGALSADCTASLRLSDRLVLIVADGAGGTSYGREASGAVIDLITHETAHGVAFDDALRIMDMLSEAWIVAGNEVSVLTEAQSRKPLLGAGAAPTPFAVPGPLQGTLIVASDGLFAYATQEQIVRACTAPSVTDVAHELAKSARLASGSLQDDLSLFVVRGEPLDPARGMVGK